MPPAPRRVLVTRAGDRQVRALRAAGLEVEQLPTLATTLVCEPADALTALLAEASPWIAVTSANAARGLAAAAGPQAAELAGARFAAIGPGSEAALAEAGWRAALVPEAASAEALADALLAAGVEAVTFAHGNLAREALPERLAAAGVAVRRLCVYRTEPAARPADAARRLAVDVITFASPSAVRFLLELATPAEREALRTAASVAIGPTTAAAVRDAGLRLAAVADPHTIDGLIEATLALAG